MLRNLGDRIRSRGTPTYGTVPRADSPPPESWGLALVPVATCLALVTAALLWF
jgi:hypothetical protein